MDKVKEAIERCRRVIYLGDMAWEKYGNKQYEKNHMASFDERDVETLIKTAQSYAALKEKVDKGELKIVPVEPVREMWAAMGDAQQRGVLVGRINVAHDFVSGAIYKAGIEAAPKYDMEG